MSDISILGDAHTCPDCGVECEAVVTYDPSMKERVDAWACPECEATFYRTDDDPRDWGFLHGVAKRLR